MGRRRRGGGERQLMGEGEGERARGPRPEPESGPGLRGGQSVGGRGRESGVRFMAGAGRPPGCHRPLFRRVPPSAVHVPRAMTCCPRALSRPPSSAPPPFEQRRSV